VTAAWAELPPNPSTVALTATSSDTARHPRPGRRRDRRGDSSSRGTVPRGSAIMRHLVLWMRAAVLVFFAGMFTSDIASRADVAPPKTLVNKGFRRPSAWRPSTSVPVFGVAA
jgi:hypothetical protein